VVIIYLEIRDNPRNPWFKKQQNKPNSQLRESP